MGALRAEQQLPPGPARVEQELHDFSYLVAHDLANEFRHVAEFSKLLRNDLGADTDAASYASIIAHSAERCQKMLRAIAAYSSVQTQQVLLRRWPARSVIERALVELKSNHSALEAAVRVDVEGDVYGDARLLIAAARLALENAMKFGRDGAPVIVEVRGRMDADGAWRLQISDNGEGLGRQYWDKAFGMFWRLDPDTPGLGVGLPMLRRIARRHGGDAYFADAEVGARLEIVIPGPGGGAP
jgi:light-regulated signal transduction histidine kinase (bacteriophytochrome)